MTIIRARWRATLKYIDKNNIKCKATYFSDQGEFDNLVSEAMNLLRAEGAKATNGPYELTGIASMER